MSKLCASAVEAVNDLEARVIIRGIESQARLLFCADGHVGVEAGSLRGVDALKFQIYNALSNLRGGLVLLQHARPSKPELPALSAKKDIQVLIVEDNADAAASLEKLLELCGYTVTRRLHEPRRARSGDEGASRHCSLRHRPAGQ